MTWRLFDGYFRDAEVERQASRVDGASFRVLERSEFLALEVAREYFEVMLQERPEKEIATAEIGAFVMQELKRLDKVAYVRFASVYRHFRDIGEFMSELKDLLTAKE